MAKLYGTDWTKKELYRHIGTSHQLFGIRKVEYQQGPPSLIKAYQVKTGGGLIFTVLENRCMDIFDMEYKGINLAFQSKADLHSPYHTDFRGSPYLASQGCGLLYTAGLRNVGGEQEEDGAHHYAHGATKHSPADNI